MFKVGQKVVCTAIGWALKETGKKYTGHTPRKDEIVTIKSIQDNFLILKEYEKNDVGIQRFESRFFRPLVSDKSAISELLTKFKPVEETSDCPIKEPVLN